jgi:hypothetical protein
MRGRKSDQLQMFFTIDVEARIRPDHPLRSLKRTVDEILKEWGRDLTPPTAGPDDPACRPSDC